MTAEVFSREDRELSFVPRWCIIRTIRQQTVDSHSFYVALWADRVALMYGITNIPMLYVLGRMALTHDMREIYSGDIPSTFKQVLKREMGQDLCNVDNFRNNPASEHEIKNVMSIVGGNLNWAGDNGAMEVFNTIIKTADLIEALVFLCEEMQFGNTAVNQVFDQIQTRLAKTIRKLNKMFSYDINPQDFILELKTIHRGAQTNNMEPSYE